MSQTALRGQAEETCRLDGFYRWEANLSVLLASSVSLPVKFPK